MFNGIRAIETKNIPSDILSGIIIALVSIPISMGYAQIAGLPAVFGLYGSLLPVVTFALLTSSPRYIFGVDAAPAAMVGGIIASLGIASASSEAVKVVPVITFYTAVWLLVFSVFKAGRLTEYVSVPVMGGFISGICATIILMQVPKLFGGAAGRGEIHELVIHIVKEAGKSFNIPSLIISIISITLIMISRKLMPKLPMSVIIMVLSAVLQYFTGFATKLGVITLPDVKRGLGVIMLPDFNAISPVKGLSLSLAVAAVIMAETLLAENNFASKGGYKINDNNEVLTFSACNFVSSLAGCCPVNGSVSRSTMNEQFSGRSQLTSLIAAGVMAVILAFMTPFISYLPVPVLTSIVVTALYCSIELSLAKKLFKTNKKELLIFLAAFAGVLVFGTIKGVIIGIVLSFSNVVLRGSDPPRAFLGVVSGRGGFFNLNSNLNAKPIKGVVIYRFNANLFFANVNEFKEDLENCLKEDTKAVIVDAGGINNIDTTGAETLENLYNFFTENGVHFYLTEHISNLNEQIRALGIGYIINRGGVRRTISSALRAEGYTKPYPLESGGMSDEESETNFHEQLYHEFEWAFGSEAQNRIDEYTDMIIEGARNGVLNDDGIIAITDLWNGLGSFDEDILLESLELRLSELSMSSGIGEEELAKRLETRREALYQQVKSKDVPLSRELKLHRKEIMDNLKNESPELYDKLQNTHEETVHSIRSSGENEQNREA